MEVTISYLFFNLVIFTKYLKYPSYFLFVKTISGDYTTPVFYLNYILLEMTSFEWNSFQKHLVMILIDHYLPPSYNKNTLGIGVITKLLE